MDDKQKKLLQRLKEGSLDQLGVDDLIQGSSSNLDKARQARDLAETTLGSEYLRQTGVPVPNIKDATNAQIESFLNKLKEEAYPELSDYGIEAKDLDAMGYADFGAKKVEIDPKKHGSIEELVGSLFHESGHLYDDKNKLIESLPDSKLPMAKQSELRKLQKFASETGIEPDAYDLNKIYQKGHHANIPKVRPNDSFGFGALEGLVKNKAFKSIAGPAIGLGAALATGDVSAALPTGLESENVGESPEQEDIMIAEEKARQNYDKSQARKDALAKLAKLQEK